MKRLIFLLAVLLMLTVPAQAMEFAAPKAPDNIRNMVEDEADSFGEGLWNVICESVSSLNPSLSHAASNCMKAFCIVFLGNILCSISAAKSISAIETACCISVSVILLQSSDALIRLGAETVSSISEYGKLLLPVMTAALAAQGGISTSASLYVLSAMFNSVLSTVISGVVLPLIYINLALTIANSIVSNPMIRKMKDGTKWLTVWGVKIVLYIFIGVISVTGIVSGSADAAAVKATKLAISGVVPVVGNILSDASEAILVSAGVMKNTAGVYGMLTVTAIFLTPFLKIGIQYILLKFTWFVSDIFGSSSPSKLIQDFSSTLGMILAMVASQIVLIMISTVCFMKGVN